MQRISMNKWKIFLSLPDVAKQKKPLPDGTEGCGVAPNSPAPKMKKYVDFPGFFWYNTHNGVSVAMRDHGLHNHRQSGGVAVLTWDEIQANAITFSKRWKDAHNEEAQAQSFETSLLHVFGVDDPERLGDFEYKVPLSDGHNGYIDYLWKSKIAIEFKSRGKDLEAAYRQLQNYLQHLPEEEIPDLQMVCDFENMILYRRSTKECWRFKTKDLRKHIKRFADVAGYKTQRITENQVEVNVKAAEKMARLHDALKEHGYEGHELEVYLVRLLFCLFADDTGIFSKDAFINYIENSKPDGSDLSMRIGQLFEILNMSEETRKKRTLLSEELRQFRYINGGLFASLLPSAQFNAKMRRILLDCCNFDWHKISPAIFGAIFQGVMDKQQRRELGAHYTSEENILKLINPLFLDELWAEFDRVKTDPFGLDQFHEKLGRLKFLEIITSSLIQFKVSSALLIQGCAKSKRGVQLAVA
jgi:hypothetical protein